MRVLLTGANGQVGSEVLRKGILLPHEMIALNRADLDITDRGEIKQVFDSTKPQLLINAAAYTAVDKAEDEPDLAFAVNRDGSANLARACAQARIPMLHLSTDYVFNGHGIAPYRELDPVSPLGVYGRSKWEGEEIIRSILAQHIIMRVSWVFGPGGNNFVKTMLRLSQEHDELRVVGDQWGCPTYAGDIADALWMLVNRIEVDHRLPWGTYHYCGHPAVSWHEFAEAIVNAAAQHRGRAAPGVVPISTEDYPTRAERPANSILDCGLIQHTFGIFSGSWRDGLRIMLQPPKK